MDSLRKMLNDDEGHDEESHILGGDVSGGGESLCPSLSYQTRIQGFIGCCVLGFVLSIVGVILAFLGNYLGFGLLYTFGSLTAICSTFFLRGPMAQLKSMFKETRIIATIVMLLMLALTLMAAIWWGIPLLALLFCMLQFLAFTWYSLSYIPFARDAVKKCFGSCLS